MNFDEQLYLDEIAHLREQNSVLKAKLDEWENSELKSDVSTHIYMNGNPQYQIDGKVPASTSSFVQAGNNMVLQKNMYEGYGWSFGNTHLSYTVDNRLTLSLVTTTGKTLKTSTANHRPIFGDLSSYQINATKENNFLPIYYDNNTGKYTCIKANYNTYTYTDDQSILHPFFRPS